MQKQRNYRAIKATTKARNVWTNFTTVELETKPAELRKLFNSGALTDRSLEHQFTEIAIIENELAGRVGG